MSKFFINRPIVAMVISIIMVIVGVVAMLSLPTSQFPNIVPPEVLVQATYPGADAKTLEESVATPIEQQVTGVDHMNYMYSTNANNGAMALTVDFDIATNPDIDQVLTQLRVSQAVPQLPAQVNTSGVTVIKSLASPLMFVMLYSPKGTYDTNFLVNYAYINMADELTRVPGVARVQVFGGQYAMRVWVDPNQLAKLSVTVPQIVSAMQVQNNVNPAGQIGAEPIPGGQEFTYTVQSQGRLVTPEQFGQIVIRANPDGSILRLKDVARIELGAQTYNVNVRYNGQIAAGMAIYQLPGSNAVAAAAAVYKKLAELQKRYPTDMASAVPLDTTKAVTEGLHEIVITLGIALGLVILVVYVFLQGWRATLIPLLAVPVSLIGTFVVFPALGFSINTLSLLGLVLAIGLVVDDAIVVVEAVEHHIEEGMSPKEASIAAMEQVASPVIAIALILAAVFIPTAAVPGITGRLYQQFAITIAISVLFSAFNALTLSPALCALLLKPKKPSRGPLGYFFSWFNRAFGRTRNGYVRTSGFLIRKSGFALVFLLLVSVAAVWIARGIPNSFLPDEDQGYLYVGMVLPYAASLERTTEASKSVEDVILKTPGVQSIVSVNGFSLLSFTQSTYTAFYFVTLKPWDQRKAKNEQYIAIQQHIAQGLGGIRQGIAFSFPPPAIPGVGTSGGVSAVLEDRSGGTQQNLTDNVNKFMAALHKRPEIASVITTYLPDVPQIYVDVDRAKAVQEGVNLGDVYQTLQTFMGGYLVNYFNRFGRQWQTYVEAEGTSRTSINDINQYYVQNASGNSIPLSALTSVKRITGPEFTMRYNEYEAAQLIATANPGYSSAQATDAFEQVFRETMPSEMALDYQGMSFQEQKAAQGVSSSTIFGVSLLFVFLILAAQYESWSLPFSVLLSTPIAVFGGFLALSMRSLENNVYAQIGLVMLIGLAAKNAILIVEFARSEYQSGKTIYDAALAGAELRLRPILMTAFAFILGCIPLWTASGAGGISRQVLGTVVIGGMLASTLIAIFIVPVTFAVVERLTHRVGTRRARKETREPVISGDAL
ncbi:MAG TPA: multidrug efflux RND transporter permease subunit [Acidobacteriaceae bacterium]|jgi:HAE1 family hydrophobic/amphiphilic exporter-1